MPRTPRRSTRATLTRTLTLALALALGVLLLTPALATLTPFTTSGLSTPAATAAPTTQSAQGTFVLRDGHADFGPTIDDSGTMGLTLRDDTISPPQWRAADDMVFVLDAASTQQLPAGTDFAFTGAAPGDQVYVVPQTQKPNVPWLGWNTQSPSLEGAVDRGVTFEYLGHQGPGSFSLFLQDGGLGGPEQVFVDPGNTAFVDLGTHTHANWVFTEPGTHIVRIAVTAGDRRAEGNLRFAIADSVTDADIADASTVAWEGHSTPTTGGPDSTLLLGLGLLGAALLLGVAAWWIRRPRPTGGAQ